MQYFGQENIPPVVKASTTSLTLAATYLGQPTIVKVGGQTYTTSSTITLNTGTTGINGIDTGSFTANTLYYVYAVVSSGVLGLMISTSGPSTGPTGFTSAYKYLAKFRTFNGSATIADINPTWVGSSLNYDNGAGTQWTTYTPSLGGFTASSTVAYWRRVGLDSIEIQAKAILNSTVSATMTIGIPTGYLIDSTKTNINNNFASVGIVQGFKNSTGAHWTGTLVANDGDNVSFAILPSAGETTRWSASTPFTWASADTIVVKGVVPIVEWNNVFTID